MVTKMQVFDLVFNSEQNSKEDLELVFHWVANGRHLLATHAKRRLGR